MSSREYIYLTVNFEIDSKSNDLLSSSDEKEQYSFRSFSLYNFVLLLQ